ncbi:hypothetical protein EV361DRAFT_1036526 [Lentinula raphanica]|nr:hypothetical protein EV361DRAFT_1036526 [Lentinula raphanica]
MRRRPQLLSLPNELLHFIIEYIAYNPILPLSPASYTQRKSRTLFKSASPDLLALSVVGRQPRRLCLPFLFANAEIQHQQHLEKLKEHLAVLSRYIKILLISSFDPLHGIQDVIFQLKRLRYVDLRCHIKTRTLELLKTILANPTVTVLVHDLPDASMCEVDLSRVILNDRTEWEISESPTLQKYLDQGMRLMCLELLNPDSLDDQQLSSKSFPGLTEIQIHTDTIKPISFSWLSELSSTHSTLNELWLLDGCGNYFPRHIPPFVSPFIDQGKDLKNLYAIQNVGYRRAIGQSSQEWYVMGLALRTIWAGLYPIKALELVASSFPKLEKLALNFSCDAREAMYDINDLIHALAQLSSLRVVHLDCIYKRLIFGSEDEKHISLAREVQGDSVTFDLLVDRVERALLLFASRLAEHVRSLDFVYIHDMGFDYDKSGTLRYNWYLSGWLRVLTSNRDVGGKLKRRRGY